MCFSLIPGSPFKIVEKLRNGTRIRKHTYKKSASAGDTFVYKHIFLKLSLQIEDEPDAKASFYISDVFPRVWSGQVGALWFFLLQAIFWISV